MDVFALNTRALQAEQLKRNVKVIVLSCVLAIIWVAIPLALGFRPTSIPSFIEQGLNIVLLLTGVLIIAKPSWRLSSTQVLMFIAVVALIPFVTSSSWLEEAPNSKPGLVCAIFIAGVGFVACIAGHLIMRGSQRRFGSAPVILITICVIAAAGGLSAYCEVDSARHLSCHSIGIICAVLIVFAVTRQERVFGETNDESSRIKGEE